jgi:triacylglycerol lipase
MTDYEGLGTPGLHTYVSRVAEANAMLDAARAAKKLADTSLNPEGPIAFWGYSQGGGAAAAAAESASQYAPELDIVGTYAGAPPANLKELFPYADGSVLVGAVGYALNSVMTTYPEHEAAIRATLTPRGTDMLFKVQDQCVAETLTKFMFRHLQPYFNQDITALVNQEPFNTMFEEQRIGRLKPNAPVLINNNRFDPLVPWTAANQMGRDWCAQGADVEFRTNEQPPFLNKAIINHALPMLVDGEAAMQWIAGRFNGVPSAPNCGSF